MEKCLSICRRSITTHSTGAEIARMSSARFEAYSVVKSGCNLAKNSDLLLTFYVNAFQFKEFEELELGILRFVDCERYRLGSTNDEGWYRGKCRFSKLSPEWGQFYLVVGDEALLNAPDDWKILNPCTGVGKHFLFYFRDNTFECVAKQCFVEETPNNSLQRIDFVSL